MIAMDDAVEKKLDMSLDDIVVERKVSTTQKQQQPPLPPLPAAGNGAANSRNAKRSDRRAQTSPYPSRDARGNDTVAYHTKHYNANNNSNSTNATNSVVSCRVYVGNLPWSVQWPDLKDHMRKAGEVVHASILETNGRSKGCGVVEFANANDAQHAIELLNDSEIHGRKIFVREDREKNDGRAGSGAIAVATTATSGRGPALLPSPRSVGVPGTRVYVGNLSWTVKWQELKDHMKSVGTVKYCDVMEEPSGRSKGCGLVEFASPQEAQRAIQRLTDTELDGRKIFVREDREPDGGSISSLAHRQTPSSRVGAPQQQQQQHQKHNAPMVGDGVALYVGNLPWDVTWQSLKDLFRSVGDVERTEVATFPDGKSRGFGIVRFVHARDALQAIHRFNGADLHGRALEVRYDKGRA